MLMSASKTIGLIIGSAFQVASASVATLSGSSVPRKCFRFVAFNNYILYWLSDVFLLFLMVMGLNLADLVVLEPILISWFSYHFFCLRHLYSISFLYKFLRCFFTISLLVLQPPVSINYIL